jgi:hypothetical protein
MSGTMEQDGRRTHGFDPVHHDVQQVCCEGIALEPVTGASTAPWDNASSQARALAPSLTTEALTDPTRRRPNRPLS